MALNLILGASGAGKTHYLYDKVTKGAYQKTDKQYFVIVPEQFTMQTQKDIVAMMPGHGTMNIDIVSFGRLAYRISQELGEHQKLLIDDMGKNLILRKVAQLNNDSLTVLKGKLDKPGFIEEIKSVISELTQYGVTTDIVKQLASDETINNKTRQKLKDIHILFSKFNEYIKDKYVTSQEILSILGDNLDKSNLIKNSVVCIDGFTGFTPLQYEVISKLLKYCENVNIALTISPYDYNDKNTEHELFHLTKTTITKLKEVAIKELKDVKEIMIDSNPVYRIKDNEDAMYLEKNIFRYPIRDKHEYKGKIDIIQAQNEALEISYVRDEILLNIRENNLRFNDFAVITGDMERYYRLIINIFGKSNIRCFVDYKRHIMTNPAVCFIKAAIEIVQTDYSYESVFRYLKTGMTALNNEQICVLENYVMEFAVKGHTYWTNEWIIESKDIKNYTLVELNQIRKIISDELEEFYTEFKTSQCLKDMTTALYKLMVRQEVSKHLQVYEEQFEQAGDLSKASEYKKIYKLIIELFDKMVSLLGDEVISIKEYLQLMETGLSEIKIGIIPPGIDQVVVGDIERTRLSDIKVLFFIGVNDDTIPNCNTSKMLLSQVDRRVLLEKKVELSPGIREKLFIQRFYLYLLLTKASKRVHISYSRQNMSGEDRKPAYLIDSLKKLFTDACEHMYSANISTIVNEDEVFNYIADRINNKTKDKDELYYELLLEYADKPAYKKLIQAVNQEKTETSISSMIAKRLYGEDKKASVTELERYANCAYQHFLQFGLNLVPRPIYEVQKRDLGTLYHSAIELYFKKLATLNMDIITVSDEDRTKYVNECVETVVNEYSNKAIIISARNRYLTTKIKRVTDRTIWAITEHLSRGDFAPEEYEFKFDNNNIVSERYSNLIGKIDRIDLCKEEENNTIYVKIIDYKSGNKKFSLQEVKDGVSIQLTAYMGAILDYTQNKYPTYRVIPAGMYYSYIKDPYVDPSKKDKRIAEFCMQGLTNKDPHIYEKIDRDFKSSNKIITDPEKSENSGMNTDDFNMLIDEVYTDIQIRNDEILNGNAESKPYEKSDPCKYCDYAGICNYKLLKGRVVDEQD